MTLIWDRDRFPDGPPPIEIMRDPIREGLRGLVRAGLIYAWAQPQEQADGSRLWRVIPNMGESQPYDDAGMIRFLELAGVWDG